MDKDSLDTHPSQIHRIALSALNTSLKQDTQAQSSMNSMDVDLNKD